MNLLFLNYGISFYFNEYIVLVNSAFSTYRDILFITLHFCHIFGNSSVFLLPGILLRSHSISGIHSPTGTTRLCPENHSITRHCSGESSNLFEYKLPLTSATVLLSKSYFIRCFCISLNHLSVDRTTLQKDAVTSSPSSFTTLTIRLYSCILSIRTLLLQLSSIVLHFVTIST